MVEGVRLGMAKKKETKSTSDDLRRQAEERLMESKGRIFQADGDAQQRMLHELQVHQVELEMQNVELRQTRTDLEKLLEKYTNLYEFAPVGYLTLDRNGAILEANLTGTRFLGLERSRLAGRRFIDFFDRTTRPTWTDFLQEVFSNANQIDIVAALHRANNTPLWVQIQAVADSSGEACQVALLDISGLKQAEEERASLQRQLEQAQKIEAIGLLAGGVAHDFNNMLGVILGRTELALMTVGPSSPFLKDLEEIRTAAKHSADLTRQLLTFARKQIIAPKVLDLNETVAGMLKMLQRLIGENIHLSWNPLADLWLVKVDPSQVDQILANLCVNARDAIDGIGKISIQTGNTTFDENFTASHPYVSHGDYVRLTFSDDGKGMDKNTQERIFVPFFTTKEVGQGTGLGLATVYGAVKQNHGFITVYSELGLGTTFNIYLPKVKSVEKAVPAALTKPVRQGTETILLVEDNEMLLRMLAAMLEKNNYSVLSATNAGFALSLAQRHPGPIHLLLSDVIMPEMNGKELSEKLLSLRPEMGVIFMSGYTADIIASQGLIPEGIHFLQKPVPFETLTAKVREVLDTALQTRPAGRTE